jgi:predicted RNase H-like HicB family nuclease
MMRRYLIVVEQTDTGYSAYSPDVPGCVATGRTHDQVEQEMREALAFHVEGLRRAGAPVPHSTTYATFAEFAS